MIFHILFLFVLFLSFFLYVKEYCKQEYKLTMRIAFLILAYPLLSLNQFVQNAIIFMLPVPLTDFSYLSAKFLEYFMYENDALMFKVQGMRQ